MHILPFEHSSPYPFYTNHIGYVKGKSSTNKEKCGNCPNSARLVWRTLEDQSCTHAKRFNLEPSANPGFFGRAVDKMGFWGSMDFITIARMITSSGRHGKTLFPYNRKPMDDLGSDRFDNTRREYDNTFY